MVLGPVLRVEHLTQHKGRGGEVPANTRTDRQRNASIAHLLLEGVVW